MNNKDFQTKTTTLDNNYALEFTGNNTGSAEIWGGDKALSIRGLLVKMVDGRALMVIHYQGGALQKNGNFVNDEVVFDQILSTFQFISPTSSPSAMPTGN